MPRFRGNPRTSHCCAGPDGKPRKPPWRYPGIANPPQGACRMGYVMALPSNLSNPQLREWEPSSNQTLLVHGVHGYPAAEYTAMRQSPQANFTAATRSLAADHRQTSLPQPGL